MAPLVTTEKARATFAELLGRARFAGARTVVTSRGRPVAAVVSLADLQRLERLEAARARPTPATGP
jgi:prevent-host-death family protein